MVESVVPDTKLSQAAKEIFEACFTLAPISFEEARRRGTLHYRRAIAAAEAARNCLIGPDQ